jgi:hypothetical protein
MILRIDKIACAKELEKLTACDVGKLLPIPDVSDKKFPETKALELPRIRPTPTTLTATLLEKTKRRTNENC